ncbi:MAG TPA: hypothetical protein VFG00_12785 [Acidothermaceae bacterium]|nr:hypothetical protein [Acidothermaceae bacterium]
MSGFRYRLYLENGEDVGTFHTAAPDWSVGDEFRTGDGNRFAILNLVTDDDFSSDDFAGMFVVTPIELAIP